MSDAGIPLESLLSHREWVRRVARALVADAADAEDLEQETWLRALEHRPRTGGAVKGWLRTVMRRAAVDQHRSRERRRRREMEAVPPGPAVPTADLVAEAETHRRVVEAVMGLEEPCRSAVVLHYFHGLTAAAVAAREGVPEETVRTRLRRARARLRERLDGESGGDGRAWAVAFLPLLRGSAPEAAGAGAGFSLATVGAAAAVVVVVGVAGGVALLGGGGWERAEGEVVGALSGADGGRGGVTKAVPPGRGDGAADFHRPQPGVPSSPARPPFRDDAEEPGGSVPAAAPAAPPAGAPAEDAASFEEAFAIVNNPGDADPAHLDRALELLRGLVAAGQREGQCRVGIGRCLFRLGRLDEAKVALEEGLGWGGFGPFTRSWAWLRLGCIADLAGRRQEAMTWYGSVLALEEAPELDHQKRMARRLRERSYRGYALDR